MNRALLGGLTSLLLPLAAYGHAPRNGHIGQQRALPGAIEASFDPERRALDRPLGVRADEHQTGEEDLTLRAGTPVTELVVLDGSVPDAHTLLRGLRPGIEVVEVDPTQPGLPQLVEALGAYRDLAAVHIVSHAEAGVLLLGNSRVDAQALQDDLSAIAALRGAVRSGGDLLIYGCSVARGEGGEALLDLLRDVSGMDVAASDDLTGDKFKGGDWDLEIQRGDVSSDLAFSRKALTDFARVLAPTEITALQIYNAAGANYYAQTSLDSPDGRIVFSSPGGVVSASDTGSTYGQLYANDGPPDYIPNSMQIAADGVLATTFEIHQLKLCAWDSTDAFSCQAPDDRVPA